MTTRRAITGAFVAILLGGTLLVVLAYLNAPLRQTPTTLRLSADLGAALIQRAQAQGRPQQALYYLQAQAAHAPWTAAEWWLAGDLWAQMGDPVRALAHWATAAQMEGSPQRWRTLAQTYLAQGRIEETYAALEAMLALEPESSWARTRYGLILAASDPLRARPYLQAASLDPDYGAVVRLLLGLLNTPDDPALPLQVGLLLAAQEHWALAEYAFRYAAAWNYPMPLAEAYVALMRVRQGRSPDLWLQAALDAAPEDADVRYVQGLVLRALGDLIGSSQAFFGAILSDPSNAAVYAELGYTYRLRGDLQEAEYWLELAIDLSGNDPALRDALARFYAEEASSLPIELLQRLQGYVLDAPEDPELLSSYGWALHQQGFSEQGLSRVEAALAIAPDHPRALYDKARILIDLERFDEARPLLLRLLEEPSSYQALARRLLQALP